MPKLLALAAVLVAAPLAAVADPVLAPPGATPATPVASSEPCEGRWGAHHRWRHFKPRRAFVGFGLAKGGIGLEGDDDGSQKAFIARAQGKRGFGIELELARTRFDASNARTAGVSLVKSFGKRRLQPYVLAGFGGGELAIDGRDDSKLRYREVGIGLLLRGRRIAIGADVRRGSRHVEYGALAAPDVAPMMTSPAMIDLPTSDDRESYTRGRILALITF